MDNPIYNRIVKVLEKKINYRKPIIKEDKIKYIFEYNGLEYWGQCFDKRLILSKIRNYSENFRNLDQLFNILTSRIGREKYFLGLDKNIIKNINKKNTSFLENYSSNDIYQSRHNIEYIQMSDGALFIKSKNGELPEMERQFPEDEVKERLIQIINRERNEWHKCGAPCKSREKEGKPCEIKTFREHCHFHR